MWLATTRVERHFCCYRFDLLMLLFLAASLALPLFLELLVLAACDFFFMTASSWWSLTFVFSLIFLVGTGNLEEATGLVNCYEDDVNRDKTRAFCSPVSGLDFLAAELSYLQSWPCFSYQTNWEVYDTSYFADLTSKYCIATGLTTTDSLS